MFVMVAGFIVRVPVIVGMVMRVFFVVIRPVVVMIGLQVDIELRPADAGSQSARHVEMIVGQTQLLKLLLQTVEIHSEVKQGPDEHVPADAAEDIEVERVHVSSPAARALIWLAA
jgi:hypothetical protein